MPTPYIRVNVCVTVRVHVDHLTDLRRGIAEPREAPQLSSSATSLSLAVRSGFGVL